MCTRRELPSSRSRIALALLVGISCAAGPRVTHDARDFTPEVLALYRVAACGGEGAPEGFDAQASKQHCQELEPALARWRREFLAEAAPWFRKLFDHGTPTTAVYPFGGGDLLTFLAVYPDATEYTTLSLEGMGDPRPVLELERADFADAARAGEALARKLEAVRAALATQLAEPWNTTILLSAESEKSGTGALPGVLVMTLVALEAHGYEPVAARYFTLSPDGTLHYLTQADVDAADEAEPPPPKADEHVLQVGAFNDVEITFRKCGDPAAPLKTFRHIAADLSDEALEKDPSALAHLAQKGEIAAMTKAASHLLWLPGFGRIRDYLLAHMTVMVSDDTGIPPRFARAAGFKQHVWGEFDGAYFTDRFKGIQEEFKELWDSSSKGKLPFRFGYPDKAGNGHLLFTFKR